MLLEGCLLQALSPGSVYRVIIFWTNTLSLPEGTHYTRRHKFWAYRLDTRFISVQVKLTKARLILRIYSKYDLSKMSCIKWIDYSWKLKDGAKYFWLLMKSYIGHFNRVGYRHLLRVGKNRLVFIDAETSKGVNHLPVPLPYQQSQLSQLSHYMQTSFTQVSVSLKYSTWRVVIISCMSWIIHSILSKELNTAGMLL